MRLRFDAELLIGECVPPLDAAALIPDALLLSGLGAGLIAAATILVPGLRSGSVWGTLGATAACAVATFAGLRMRGRRRWRRGFVVNFDQHLVRLDRPRSLRTMSETTSLPFREVDALQVVDRAAGQCALELSARGERYVLVDQVPGQGREQLQTLCRLLQAAVAKDLGPREPGGR